MRDVHTRIPDEYWQRAMMHNLRWNDLLIFAIDVQTNDFFFEGKKILEKIRKLEMEIKGYKKQFERLEEAKLKKQKLEKESKKLKENSCSDCGTELNENFKNMGKGIKLCRACFLNK